MSVSGKRRGPVRIRPAARRREVVARAERIAGAGDDPDVLLRVGVEGDEGVAQLVHRGVVVGVALLGTVEGEDGHVAVTVDAQAAHGCGTVPPACTRYVRRGDRVERRRHRRCLRVGAGRPRGALAARPLLGVRAGRAGRRRPDPRRRRRPHRPRTRGVRRCATRSRPSAVADVVGHPLRFHAATGVGAASQAAGVGLAALAVANGLAEVVVVPTAAAGASAGYTAADRNAAVEHMAKLGSPFEAVMGTTRVADFAMVARRHMHEYGTTSEQLAAVAVAQRHSATLHPRAVMGPKGDITVERGARVADDGGAAAPPRLLPRQPGRRMRRRHVAPARGGGRARIPPVVLLGWGEGHGYLDPNTAPSLTSFSGRVAADGAFRAAGVHARRHRRRRHLRPLHHQRDHRAGGRRVLRQGRGRRRSSTTARSRSAGVCPPTPTAATSRARTPRAARCSRSSSWSSSSAARPGRARSTGRSSRSRAASAACRRRTTPPCWGGSDGVRGVPARHHAARRAVLGRAAPPRAARAGVHRVRPAALRADRAVPRTARRRPRRGRR